MNPREKLLAVRKTSRKTKNTIPWECSAISAREFNGILFELMGWQKGWQCKVPASVLHRGYEKVLMFDLSNCEYKFRPGGKNTRYVRVIPDKWGNASGIDTIDFMLRPRRIFAEKLSDWRLGEAALAVEGFDTYIEPHTRETIDSMIRELTIDGD